MIPFTNCSFSGGCFLLNLLQPDDEAVLFLMNFLSHYFVDQDHSDPYFVTGLILPDLARIFHPKWRLNARKIRETLPDNKDMDMLCQGIARHESGDLYFHNSDFFHTHTTHIKDVLNDNRIKSVSTRSYFLAHVLLELLLDRLIVKQMPEIPENFYATLSKIDPEKLRMYLKHFNFVYDPWEFLAFFERFIQSRYLLAYKHNEKFIFALNRVYTRVNPVRFTEQERRELSRINTQLEQRLSVQYLSFFDALRKHLN